MTENRLALTELDEALLGIEGKFPGEHQNKEKGEEFERLVLSWLENDPLMQAQYKSVEHYGEWALRTDQRYRDLGIDLIATRRDGHGVTAVQCKFYRGSSQITKDDLNTFIADSARETDPPITGRMLVETSERKWHGNAEETVKGQNPPVQRVGLGELEQSAVDWQAISSGEGTKREENLTPRQVKLRIGTELLNTSAMEETGLSGIWLVAPGKPLPHC